MNHIECGWQTITTYNSQRISLSFSSDIHSPLFPDDKDLHYSFRCSKSNAKRSEASAEIAEGSESHGGPQKRRKRAVFEDFEEIVINVIGKLSYFGYWYLTKCKLL